MQILAALLLFQIINVTAQESSSCTSSLFTSQVPVYSLGDSMAMQFILSNDKSNVCFKVTCTTTDDEWMAISISPTAFMVQSPVPTDAIVFDSKSMSTPSSFILGGYSASSVTAISNSSSMSFISGAFSASSGLEMVFSRPTTISTSTTSAYTSTAINLSSESIILYAHGSSWPSAHSPSSRGSTSINFDSGIRTEIFIRPSDNRVTAVYTIALLILLSVAGTFVTKLIPNTSIGHALLQSRLGKPKTPSALVNSILDLKLGEVYLMLLYSVALLWIATSVYVRNEKTTNLVSSLYAIAFGNIASTVLAFTLLTISKIQCVWTFLFGISSDRLVKFHRINSRLLLTLVIIHLLFARQVCKDLFSTTEFGSQAIVPLYGLIAFVAMLLSVLVAIERIRRRIYNVFLISHRVLAPVIIISASLHTSVVLYVITIALVAVSIGLGLRAKAFWRRIPITAITTTSKTVVFIELTSCSLTQKWAKQMQPGAFCWLNFPLISKFEWHPFSVMPSPSGDTIGFAIKAMEGGFTCNIATWANHAVAMDAQGSGSRSTTTDGLSGDEAGLKYPQILLDGLYGKLALEPAAYHRMVLVAGGIGITPLVGIINQSKWHESYISPHSKLRRIDLIWIVRHPEDLLMVEKYLFQTEAWLNSGKIPPASNNMPSSPSYKALQSPVIIYNDDKGRRSDIEIHYTFFVTSANGNGEIHTSNGDQVISYFAKRPIESELQATLTSAHSNKTAVVACGPEPLVNSVQHKAMVGNCDFHKEVFKW